MKLYHGSNLEIEQIDLEKCRPSENEANLMLHEANQASNEANGEANKRINKRQKKAVGTVQRSMKQHQDKS